jgi:hypothetical protein
MNVVALGSQPFREVQDVAPGTPQGGFQDKKDLHCILAAEVR